MPGVRKATLLLALLVLSLPLIFLAIPKTTSADEPIVNGGFETGDFSGWNVSVAPLGGNAQVVSTFNVSVPTLGNYTAKEGNYFALLTNGQQDVYTIVSQPFQGGRGLEISGWSFFYTDENGSYLPYFNDKSMVEITLHQGTQVLATVFQARVSTVGTTHGTPWTAWSFDLPRSAEYTIQARVTNIDDSSVHSYLGLDGVSIDPIIVPTKPRSSPTMPASNAISIIAVKNVVVNPQQAYTGQPINISANVANDGDAVGGFSAYLKINGKVEQTRTGVVDGHSAIPVNFTVSKSEPGAYTVDIGGQKSTFTIVGDKTASAPTVNSGAVLIAVMLALILGTAVVLVLTFRRG